MNSNAFWDKVSELYYLYELDGVERYLVLNMNGGMEIILSSSTLEVGGEEIIGVLEDGTEIIISIENISTLRYNPYWKSDILDDFGDF